MGEGVGDVDDDVVGDNVGDDIRQSLGGTPKYFLLLKCVKFTKSIYI